MIKLFPLYIDVLVEAVVIGYSCNLQVFATPETLIGFHPDAGASFYLSHLPGHLGMLAWFFMHVTWLLDYSFVVQVQKQER